MKKLVHLTESQLIQVTGGSDLGIGSKLKQLITIQAVAKKRPKRH
ncbi:hypothetical protein [Pseudoalteromonas sp. MSK9-3]|nr:hypothetical protein [Pseudoalteromonas sp. MSK9-3]